MVQYAEVILDIAYGKLDHPFTYKIPPQMQGSLQLGSLVVVPFGNGNVMRKGYVVGLLEEPPAPKMIRRSGAAAAGSGSVPSKASSKPIVYKEIAELPVGDSGYKEDPDGAYAVALAAWMKQKYGSTMSTALKTVLASRKPGKPVVKKEIRLLLSEEEAREKLLFYRKKHQVARARLLAALLETPELPQALVVSKLHVNAQSIRAMEKAGVVAIDESHTLRNPVNLDADRMKSSLILLSEGQKKIIDGVVRDFDRGIPSVSLIHGITGSGKTEVYIAIIKEIVSRGRQAIMMIPEIALTYQTLMRFYRHFGDRVSVMNSSLSEGEKADQWERARRGEIDVMIGPRSALFTPFEKLGVIVIDEEHESSYKNESMPKYHSRDVAAQIVKMKGGVLVLGSATPSMDAYYRAVEGDREIYRLYEMNERLTGGTLPEVEVADMREELRHGNRSILSERLKVLLEDRLHKGEQTMLFLNRRGFSGFVSCRSCGTVIKCPHCDVSMSMHKTGSSSYMACHYCGYRQPMVRVCPECSSPYVSGFRAGTEQIEEQLQMAYPNARILRLDADTTAKKGSFDKILSAFANEEADILLGTQMIVKGHDFPKVTLVGVLMADLSLHAVDYRAAERTFQLLTQAAGRAGRGELPGNVVIQTYQPDHYAILHAAKQDYKSFYEEELIYRRIMHYPPVTHMMAVQISSANEDKAEGFAGELRELFQRLEAKMSQKTQTETSENHSEDRLIIVGPARASLSRLKDNYRFALYVKCTKYDKLVACKDRTEAYLQYLEHYGRDVSVQVQFDFDPVNGY